MIGRASQASGQLFEPAAMEIHGVGWGEQDGVITPQYPFGPQALAEREEEGDDLPILVWDARLQILPIPGERELEVVGIAGQGIQMREHGRRILAPEYPAVHRVGA